MGEESVPAADVIRSDATLFPFLLQTKSRDLSVITGIDHQTRVGDTQQTGLGPTEEDQGHCKLGVCVAFEGEKKSKQYDHIRQHTSVQTYYQAMNHLALNQRERINYFSWEDLFGAAELKVRMACGIWVNLPLQTLKTQFHCQD